MRVNLYRRHKPNCIGSHPWQSRSSELEERRKTWKRCDCVIHFSATISGEFGRKATGTTDWEEARAYATSLAASGSWNGQGTPAPAKLPAPAGPQRVTIEEGIRVYLANREATVAAPTYRKYKTFTKQLQTYAESKGYVCLDQFRPADIDIYFTSSKLAPLSKAKMLDWLRAFWRFAVNREWVVKSPVSPDLKPPTGATRPPNKMPFTDRHLELIRAACGKVKHYEQWGNAHGSGVRTGQDVLDFIDLMVETGLRISDVVLFDIDRLHVNNVFLRAKKNGGDVYGLLSDDLRDRLQARAKRLGKQPFMIGQSKRLDTVIDVWRQQIARVFELVDLGPERAHPHRFRHTFARRLLERGVSVAHVADLMGDTEQVIRRSYNRWVIEKQEALTAELRAKLFNDKPKLTSIRGGRR